MYKTFSKMALILCLTPAFLFAQTYKVVLNPNSPPKAFRDESGLFIGIDADLTNLMVHGVLEESHYGFVVKKDQTELLNKINAGLAEIKANGEFDKIVESWLGKAGN